MIAMSGCARRNADRELARVLAFIDKRMARLDELVAERSGARWDALTNDWTSERAALGDLRADLERLEHRKCP